MRYLILKLKKPMLLTLMLITGILSFSASAKNYSDAELDQILAPIALYPDTVLTHILIASTNPVDVVQASRWLESQSNLSKERLLQKAEMQNWEPSVTALIAFPDILERLNNDLTWTSNLGYAFLHNESQVMERIQTLRLQAYSTGSLNNSQHLIIERESQIIRIEPAQKALVYIPVYDPRIVYGTWAWVDHPPVFWHVSSNYHRPISWSTHVVVTPGFYFGLFDWRHHKVMVHQKPPRHFPKMHEAHRTAKHWQHKLAERPKAPARHEFNQKPSYPKRDNHHIVRDNRHEIVNDSNPNKAKLTEPVRQHNALERHKNMRAQAPNHEQKQVRRLETERPVKQAVSPVMRDDRKTTMPSQHERFRKQTTEGPQTHIQ